MRYRLKGIVPMGINPTLANRVPNGALFGCGTHSGGSAGASPSRWIVVSQQVSKPQIHAN
jgi:hypothetical protein